MREVKIDPLLLDANDETVQIAQRQTTTGFMLAALATVGMWVWRYVAMHHLNLTAIEMTLAFYCGGRICTYFMCRLDPTLKWIAIGMAIVILVASAFIALLP